jgi:hypothetical protein
MSLDLKLIELYKNRPTLWDSRLEEYKISEKKPALWLEIADELSLNAGEARKRMASVKRSYRRCKKQLSDYINAPSGSGMRKGKKPTQYKYAAELAFLEEVMNVDDTEDNIGDVDEQLSSGENDSGEETSSKKVSFSVIMRLLLSRT